MLSARRKLAELGVMGMNRRNGDYVMRYNARHLYPLVDDKLRTKELALEQGIAVPELYGVIKSDREIRNLPSILKDHQDFVVKPSHGAGGDGIQVITGMRNGMYQRASGVLMEPEQLEHHISNTLSGMYSLGGHPDQAMIEYRVRFDPLFEKVSFQGVPDIRTLVFFGYPIMAMVRLPTRASDGKANLHQGAVGVGIDIVGGHTCSGVCRNLVVDTHPDTGNPIKDLQIPNWDTLMLLAARCYDFTGLGYLGVDVVLDHDRGPLILELNARPGLNIQIANREGLLKRLSIVESLPLPPPSAEERVAFVKQRFAGTEASLRAAEAR